MFYFQPRNKIQANYYKVWQEAGMNGRKIVLKNLKESEPSGNHYEDYYIKQADLRMQLHPYQFLCKDYTVVACGCHNGKINFGLSQPLIFSTLVKHVIVFEPDPVNLKTLNDYIFMHNIKNMTIVPKAIWHTEEDVEFTICKRTESNQIGKIGNRGRQIQIPATTLDKVILEFGYIDFIHLTINGTESQALKGAAGMLKTDTEFSIAMLFKEHGMFNHRMEALRILEKHGYCIGCADSPPRAWVTRPPFYFAVGTKDKDKLKKLAFSKCEENKIPWTDIDV